MANPAPVNLNSAASFSVLGASTDTNTGATVVSGNLGLSPGTSITGFPPGTVINGSIHDTDVAAANAQVDLTAAYNDAAGRIGAVIVSGDIGGQTLGPGVYKSTSSLGITGTLTLDGQGSAASVFIFQIASTLTTASAARIVLINGAIAANVFFQVGSSATLGTTTAFIGTIMAQASVTLTTGATLSGRALARTGAVTMDTNTITNPALLPGPPPAPPACVTAATQIVNRTDYKSWTITMLDADTTLVIPHGFKQTAPSGNPLLGLMPDFVMLQEMITYLNAALPNFGCVADATNITVSKTNAVGSGGPGPCTVIAKIEAWRAHSIAE